MRDGDLPALYRLLYLAKNPGLTFSFNVEWECQWCGEAALPDDLRHACPVWHELGRNMGLGIRARMEWAWK